MIWKPVKNFPKYEVNELCDVRNKKTGKFRIPVKRKDGYFQLKLMTSNTEFKMMLLHRILAEAWIDNPEFKPYMNHKNGIRSDNRLENLEWCTPGENMVHAFRVIKTKSSVGVKNSRAILTPKEVKAIRMVRDTPATKRILAIKYGVAESTVNNIMKHRIWKHI
jgi:hypothetical protein